LLKRDKREILSFLIPFSAGHSSKSPQKEEGAFENSSLSCFG
jgi:hypothetical protein